MGPAGLKVLRILWNIIISSQKRAGQEYNLPKLYKACGGGRTFFWVYIILLYYIIFNYFLEELEELIITYE